MQSPWKEQEAPKIEYNPAADSIMYHSLFELIELCGISVSLIQKHGAYCADVEFGPEIEALLPFDPSKLVASEPDTSAYSAYEKDEQARVKKALAAYEDYTNIEIINDYCSNAIARLKQEMRAFGLITRLNTYPGYLGEQNVRHFISEAGQILVHDGSVIVSATEKEYFERFMRIADSGIEHFEVLFFNETDREFKVAGSVGIVARKTSYS